MDSRTFLSPVVRTIEPVENGKAIALQEEPDRSKEIKKMQQHVIYSKDELSEFGIIHQTMEEKAVVNAFRNLRTSLLKKMQRANSCVLISALSKDGGADFTATNLAAAFAFDQKKTALLIDCDFSGSSLAANLGVEASYGLRDFIVEEVSSISAIIYPTVIPRLRLVPCGNCEEDYGEFFTGRKMQSFMNEITSRYPDRIVIINAPPLLESADTQILAELCDHILFVLPYGSVSPSSVKKAIKSVDSDKIAGFVIND